MDRPRSSYGTAAGILNDTAEPPLQLQRPFPSENQSEPIMCSESHEKQYEGPQPDQMSHHTQGS